MTPDRKRELLEAYGADPARWPSDENPNEVSDGADTAGLSGTQAEAGRLDALLALYTVEPASRGLQNALLEIPGQAVDIRDVGRDMGKTSRPAPTPRPVWGLLGALRGVVPQLAGLAIASALGFMVGVADLLPAQDQSVAVDVSGLALGEDGLGGFDS